ncbi:MAG: RNA polymerase sigma factor [Saprospiraceae bacterium]|nr:RNA polymerase sigma factor [Saprospiraceae bacterium]
MDKPIADDELLNGLCQGDSATIRHIYELHAQRVQKWVLANSGTVEEARDVFQDGIQALFESGSKEGFTLQSSFEGLLFTICKRQWFGVLRKKKRWQSIRQAPELIPDEEDDDMESILIRIEEDTARAHNLASTFTQLSSLCQKLLKLYAKGKPPEEIVLLLQMTDRNAVYQRRKACTDRWKVLMKQIA